MVRQCTFRKEAAAVMDMFVTFADKSSTDVNHSPIFESRARPTTGACICSKSVDVLSWWLACMFRKKAAQKKKWEGMGMGPAPRRHKTSPIAKAVSLMLITQAAARR